MTRAISIKILGLCIMFALVWFIEPLWLAWTLAGAVFVIMAAWIAWGVFNVNSSMWVRTYWRAPTESNRVALTFDDGPDPNFTPDILKVLADKDAPAAFFVVGERVAEHPEIAKAIHDAGHLIGNHSHTHPLGMNFRLHAGIRREITACNNAVRNATGATPRFYRAPHGFKNPALGDVLIDEGLACVGWQIRAFDAVRQDAATIAKRIVDATRPGGVILLHDGGGLQGTDSREGTVSALPVIIDGLRARGLEIVRLDKLLEMPVTA